MQTVSLHAVNEMLIAEIVSRLCVQVWLGYGDVLFIGFGDEILPPKPSGKRQEYPLPPYQLQTNFSAWRIAKPDPHASGRVDYHTFAEAAASRLVGTRATHCLVRAPISELDVVFETGDTLIITPFEGRELAAKWAWAIRHPDGSHTQALCNGRFRIVQGTDPPSHAV
jgi:hypothetical protein